MAALTPAESVDALLSAIEKSNLLSAELLVKSKEVAAALTDPKAVARALIKDGTLTRWQADQLLHGYHRLLIGKYKLLDQLETSPTGRIYLAEHVQMGRRHALKVLAKRLASNPDAVSRFLKGAQNACGLDHRNISHVYDVSQDRLGHYVVMEYVEGLSLEQLVEKSGPLKPPQVLDYVAQIVEGLAYAHSHGVVHGDLKPSNLVRDNSGVIKILEIGQDSAGVRPQTDDADDDIETAALAAVIFQAPELRGDGEGADIACDVYSLGSVLSFLLTGKAAKNAAAAVVNLLEINDLPADMVELCRTLMADKPGERPRSMDQVAAHIGSIAEYKIAEQKIAAADEPPKTSRKNKDKEELGHGTANEVATVPHPAKQARDDGLPIIAVAGQAPPVLPPPPVDFSIQTRGRLGKLPPGKKGNDSPAVARWSIAGLTTRFSPLVVAGAIGGAAVFAFGIATIVVLLVAANRTAQQIAKAAEAKAQALAQAASEVAAGQEEANPVAAEVNPQVSASAGAAPVDENPVVVPVVNEANARPTPPPTAPAAAPALASDRGAASPSPAAPAAVAPAAAAKPETLEVPAAVVASSPAKPVAPSGAPAKKVAGDLFKGFATAISLPPLPEPDSPVVSLKPVSLGPCDIDSDTPVAISLLGGDTAVRATRQKFEVQPRAMSIRDWDIQLTGSGEPAMIASLSIKEGELLFQWTEEAVKQSLVARNLMNSALVLGKSKQIVALRMSVKGPPLVFDIEKSSAAVKWPISNLPTAKQIFLEVTRTEGFSRFRQDPKGPTNAGDMVTIGAGPSEKSIPLLLKLSTSSSAATIDVRAQAAVKVEGWTDSRPYRRKDLIAMQAQHQQELVKLRGELRKAKDSRPRADAEKEAREATITRLANEETALNTALDQLRYILDFSGATEGAAKIHFRVYCLAGDAKIDLLRTEQEE
jgi:serine/threonine protein kinase